MLSKTRLMAFVEAYKTIPLLWDNNPKDALFKLKETFQIYLNKYKNKPDEQLQNNDVFMEDTIHMYNLLYTMYTNSDITENMKNSNAYTSYNHFIDNLKIILSNFTKNNFYKHLDNKEILKEINSYMNINPVKESCEQQMTYNILQRVK
jgi:hypothetical protein